MTGIERTLAQIDDLLYDILSDDEYQDGDILPTDYAIATAKRIVTEVGHTDCIGRATTTGGGDVRLSWRYGKRSLRLVVPSSEQSATYIYHEDGDDYATDSISDGGALENWLVWVDGR